MTGSVMSELPWNMAMKFDLIHLTDLYVSFFTSPTFLSPTPAFLAHTWFNKALSLTPYNGINEARFLYFLVPISLS